MRKEQMNDTDRFEQSLNKKNWIPWIVATSIIIVSAGIGLFVVIAEWISKALASFLGQTAAFLLR